MTILGKNKRESMLSSWTVHLRAAIFVLLAAWMIGGPMYRQLLNGDSRIPRSWVMFTGFGVGEVCDVRYTLREGDTETTLDRFSALGHDDPRSAPQKIRRVKDKKSALSLGRRLCRALDGTADVRLHARCAHKRGWRIVAQGKNNLCAP